MSPLWFSQNSSISGSSFTRALIPCDTPPNFLKYSNASSKVKTTEGVEVHSLVRGTLEVRKAC